MIAHDPVADAETKAGAFADIAGREERIENAGQVGGLDAVPGVQTNSSTGAAASS